MILEYDDIILGSSIEAFLLGSQNFWPVIFSDFRKPFRFDYLPVGLNLSHFQLPKVLEEKTLTTFDGNISVGIPKYILWERLHFTHSLKGLVPLSNLCTLLRTDDHSIICFNEYSKIAEIKFNNCHYMGDSNVAGLFDKRPLDKEEYLCYDWIAFNKGGKHDVDYIETGDSFCKQIWFYPSDRIDGNTAVKDACVVSQLTTDMIESFDYSETMARFKLVNEMENRGMRGLFNGYTTAGNPKHYKFKTTHIRRQKRLIEKKQELKPKGFINAQISQKDYFKMLQSACVDSDLFLRGEYE